MLMGFNSRLTDYQGGKIHSETTGGKGFVHGAFFFANVGAKNVEAVLTYCFTAFETCNDFSRSIEGGDSFFEVNGENPVAYIL